jgi:hypothetical protein
VTVLLLYAERNPEDALAIEQSFVAGSESRLADASQQTKPSSNPSFVQTIRSGTPVYAKCLV